jgi:hypothetical protein
VLVPYYIVHLLELIVQEEWLPGMTIGVWTVFAAIALYRKFRRPAYSIALISIVVGMALLGRNNLYDYSKVLRDSKQHGTQAPGRVNTFEGLHPVEAGSH